MFTATLTDLRAGDLAGARALKLRGGLREFPREIFDLADTLEVLDLSGHALSDLPGDLCRLGKLRALFCSGNSFTRLPPVLGDCAALSQVGFRGCGLSEVPAEALPPNLRWLTLTDNAIETLPEAIGQRPALQKLMLSGNRLGALPDSLADAGRLELLRLSSNRLDTLPPWLTELPRLAWLALAGNPHDTKRPAPPTAAIDWTHLRVGPLLGEGASGQVFQVDWTPPNDAPRPAALKLFKSAMTSDGLPESEMAACLTAGAHRNLTGALGRLASHPQGLEGLLMPLLPDRWRVLAGPPSLESCSRDVYDPALRLNLDVALRIARDVATGAGHLHARGLMHGDLYAHNILWDGSMGQAVLSDFGAASFLPRDAAASLERLEVLAWGLLLGELLDRVDGPAPAALRTLQADCARPDVRARPSLAQALNALEDAG